MQPDTTRSSGRKRQQQQQQQPQTPSRTLKILIWRVRPGVLETLATASPKRVLSMLLLPTFDRPRNAISGRFVCGVCRGRDTTLAAKRKSSENLGESEQRIAGREGGGG